MALSSLWSTARIKISQWFDCHGRFEWRTVGIYASSRGFAWPHIVTPFFGTYLFLSGYIRNEELLREIGDNHEEAKRHHRDITKRKPIGFGIPLLALLYCMGWHSVHAATMVQEFNT